MFSVFTVCQGNDDIRFSMQRSADPSSGPVEVWRHDKWLHVCRGNSDYSREAAVICRQLDYVGGWPQHHIAYPESSVIKIHCERGGNGVFKALIT